MDTFLLVTTVEGIIRRKPTVHILDTVMVLID